ncbi:thiamine-triphosphatase [Balearica regulorum gibbericeps]|uniref:thiamine-triphosphatase n=1 Tax=Balearica regulorum gibbericeps TaxID=100784 RepID=UPI003F62CFF6
MGQGSPRAAPAPRPAPIIEVELKFRVGPDTATALRALGAVGLPHAPPFRDCYFDVPGAALGRADVWLRHRQGQGWQLKLPHGDPRPPHGDPEPPRGDPRPTHGDPQPHRNAETTQTPPEPAEPGSRPPPNPPHGRPPSAVTIYREVWGDAGVLRELTRLLGVPSAPWGSVRAALAPLGLRPTASFVTRRRGVRVGRVKVELDEADFGYGLGEAEEEVTPEGGAREVEEARKRVEGVCRALGAEPRQRIPGKLSVFLARHRPRYYKLLREAGRLEEVGKEEKEEEKEEEEVPGPTQ